MRNLKDTYRHKGLRNQLVKQLVEKGINDENVLNAIGAIPRHFFLDTAFQEWAYQDKAFRIGREQTISQPYTVAYQTELLSIEKNQKILEIGTGSGYQSAVLSVLGADVYSLERHRPLYLSAKKLLNQLGCQNVICFHKDGNDGLTKYAPYDRIIVTAAASSIPEVLLDQLAVGGKLVIPVGEKEQIMLRITKLSNEDEFDIEKFEKFQFVPMLRGVEK